MEQAGISIPRIERPAESPGQRVFYLDFIRAIAILFIMTYHFNIFLVNWHAMPLFWPAFLNHLGTSDLFGDIGVSLFIILSGSSLMLSTRKELNARNFYRKRLLSIYPLFWLSYLAVFFARFFILKTVPQAGLATLPLTLTGFDGFMNYKINSFYLIGEWFLGFILIFYLLFPLIRFLFLKNRNIMIGFCILLTLVLPKFYKLHMLIGHFPLSRLLEFVMGMWLIDLLMPIKKIRNVLLPAMAAGLLFFINADVAGLFKTAVSGTLVFACLAWISLLIPISLQKYFNFLGKYSFGAFLIHHQFFVIALTEIYIAGFLNLHKLPIYVVFTLLLICIYVISFVLTNAVKLILNGLAAIWEFFIRPGEGKRSLDNTGSASRI
ncbi:MAG: acyltransferase family protein [Nitrospiraceae bacterium]|nr:acyltransferase family protein [Nitrospiraceae bacterium]